MILFYLEFGIWKHIWNMDSGRPVGDNTIRVKGLPEMKSVGVVSYDISEFYIHKAIDEPGGNRNRSINIKAQHKTRRAAITQIYF